MPLAQCLHSSGRARAAGPAGSAQAYGYQQGAPTACAGGGDGVVRLTHLRQRPRDPSAAQQLQRERRVCVVHSCHRPAGHQNTREGAGTWRTHRRHRAGGGPRLRYSSSPRQLCVETHLHRRSHSATATFGAAHGRRPHFPGISRPRQRVCQQRVRPAASTPHTLGDGTEHHATSQVRTHGKCVRPPFGWVFVSFSGRRQSSGLQTRCVTCVS